MTASETDGVRTIKSIPELFDQVVLAVDQLGPEMWWRGQAEESWPLVPGVHRGSPGFGYEPNVTLRFMRAAQTRHPRCPGREDLSSWLQLMQHYRLPTRLLDWTQSPLIALFFAVTEYPDSPGVLWGLNPFNLNRSQANSSIVFNTADPRIDALVGPAFNIDVTGPAHTLATFGEECDLRMTVQLGVFTIHGDATPLENHVSSPSFLRKFVIPQEVKDQLKISLEVLGIRRSTIFPDLENLARDLASLTFQEEPVPPRVSEIVQDLGRLRNSGGD